MRFILQNKANPALEKNKQAARQSHDSATNSAIKKHYLNNPQAAPNNLFSFTNSNI